MNMLVWITLLGAFSYHCGSIAKNFRGSSATLRDINMSLGGLGLLLFHVAIIWSFWHYVWWIPILTYIICTIVSAITAAFFQKNLIGMILSPIVCAICAIMTLYGFF